MLRAILNKSWRQHPTKHQLFGHQPPITKTLQVRRTRHAGHCWRGRDKLKSDVLRWTASHGRAKAGWPARPYILQLCEDTGCSPEDLPETMNDREECRGRVRDIRADGATRWWWCWFIFESIARSRNPFLKFPESAWFLLLSERCKNHVFYIATLLDQQHLLLQLFLYSL